METLLDAARRYYDAGLNILPASKAQKRPIGAWKQYAETRPAFDTVFNGVSFDALAVVCGETSGGVEVIDLDQGARALVDWQTKAAEMLDKDLAFFSAFVTERTQNGGVHFAYRCAQVGKNQKLALDANGGVMIETRGAGGVCIIAPSNGYELITGDWAQLPTIDEKTRETLLEAARALNEYSKPEPQRAQRAPVPQTQTAQPLTAPSVGESIADYLRRDLTPLKDALARAGWTYLKEDAEFEYWRRPLQEIPDRVGGSIDKVNKFFYCFTSNAEPFEPSRAYSPLDVITLLDFSGDISRASKVLRARLMPGRVNPVIVDVLPDTVEPPAPIEKPKEETNAPQFPPELYAAPGLIAEIQDEIARRAVRPQPAGAFLASMCAISYICGRSIELYCDGNTTTPNIYGLFLAPSGMGKEAPRRVCSEVAQIYNGEDAAPEAFASVQALQNIIVRTKKLLWLHDEFGRDLSYMTNDRNNSNIGGIITECLKLYSNANNRAYLPKLRAQEAAGVKRPAPVDRPFLSIFATGNPRDFYASASEVLLHNGYIARFTIVAGEEYAAKPARTYEERVTPRDVCFSQDFKARVSAWRAFEQCHEEKPEIIDFTREADETLIEYDLTIEDEIKRDSASIEGASEVKARFSEKLWKYALLFGASKFGARKFTIDKECAELAVALIDYEARLFKYNADKYNAGPLMRLTFDIMEWARAVGYSFTKSQFTRKFQRRGTRREREEALDNLLECEYLGKTADNKFVVMVQR